MQEHSPIESARPRASGRAGVDEELVVVFARLEAAQQNTSAQRTQAANTERVLHVGVAGYEDVDVHLARNGAERVEVAYRDALVAVNDADLDGTVDDGYGGRERRGLRYFEWIKRWGMCSRVRTSS
jgi:hypothetical protein